MQPIRIAIVQEAPIFYELEKCLSKALGLIDEAAQKGAQLVVFGETWLSGYPAFLDHCGEIGRWDNEPMKKLFGRMYLNSVEVGSKTTQALSAAAKKHKIQLIIGVNERCSSPSGTLFNTILTFNEKGELANHHRKLMPTFTEKLVHGLGDGNGLKAVETPFGKIGSLICWEHWMPLTRQAMHLEGELIHAALWPNVLEMHQLASRHYAFEGRCFVVALGQMMQVKDIPEELAIPDHLAEAPESWLLRGGSCVYGPDGKELLAPQLDKSDVFIVDLERPEQAFEERMALDVTGHYNRKDVFDFVVNKERKN